MRIVILLQFVWVLTLCTALQGQTPSPSPPSDTKKASGLSQVIGEVASIDIPARRMIVKTSTGNPVAVLLDDQSEYLRLPPGETTLSNKEVITLSAINIGDRVMARGSVATDLRSMLAHQIIVMTKAAIMLKEERDRADWLSRGIVGAITALNPETKEITLMARSRGGDHQVIIGTGGSEVKFRRYPPDSLRFGDSKPSFFAELRVGDQLRALGTKSPDGTRFIPERIVAGSFRTAGGPILSLDFKINEIKINNLQTGQPLIVAVNTGCVMRRITPEAAAVLVRRDSRNVSGSPISASARNDQEVIDHLPSIGLRDLKEGDVIVVLSTAGSNPSRVVAMMLVSGAEPLLKAAQAGPTRNTASLILGLPSGVLDGGIGLP